MRKLVRNLRDPEARLFWEKTLRAAEIVRQWPAWKRGVPMELPKESTSAAPSDAPSSRSKP
jgi:hypothetical protein